MASGSGFSKEPFVNLVGKIPERSSSLKATSHLETARKVSSSLETYQGTIKRKVSSLLYILPRDVSLRNV